MRKLVRIQQICPQKVNELAANMPVIVEALEVLSSSEQVPAQMERIVPDVVHPVNYKIIPERITCRALMTKSFLATTKTSRPYETAVPFGE